MTLSERQRHIRSILRKRRDLLPDLAMAIFSFRAVIPRPPEDVGHGWGISAKIPRTILKPSAVCIADTRPVGKGKRSRPGRGGPVALVLPSAYLRKFHG